MPKMTDLTKVKRVELFYRNQDGRTCDKEPAGYTYNGSPINIEKCSPFFNGRRYEPGTPEAVEYMKKKVDVWTPVCRIYSERSLFQDVVGEKGLEIYKNLSAIMASSYQRALRKAEVVPAKKKKKSQGVMDLFKNLVSKK